VHVKEKLPLTIDYPDLFSIDESPSTGKDVVPMEMVVVVIIVFSPIRKFSLALQRVWNDDLTANNVYGGGRTSG